MALPTDVRVISDPFAEPEPAAIRRPPPLWRVRRLLLSLTMVFFGLVLVLGTLAVFWWPGVILVIGLVMLIAGAFFVRIDPSPPKPPAD